MMNKIKEISIRARVGFALECLESILKKDYKQIEDWGFLLSSLWDYTKTNNLGKWHYKTSEMIPFSVMEDIPFSEKGCEYITENEHNRLKNIYVKVDNDVLNVINLIFEIGTLDLYSSIVDYSPRTVAFLFEIIEILETKNIQPPSIERYLIYKISDNNGWGEAFDNRI